MNSIFDYNNQLLKKYRALLPMAPEFQKRLDKKFRLEFNYNSNHIEGNTLTYGETQLLLFFDKTSGKHDMREYEEMKAHDVAFEMVKQWATDDNRPLNESEIKNLHKVIMVRPFWNEAITPEGQPTKRLIEVGKYKSFPNNVRLSNGEIFEFASVTDTPILMGELIEWYRAEENNLHPITIAAMLHYKFVRIHPFDDGNGRISRLLMNYVLMKNGYPPVVIKSASKRDYYFALNQADTGDYEAFIHYIAGQVSWSLDISIKAAKGENIDEPGDYLKKVEAFKKSIGVDPTIQLTKIFSKETVEGVVKDVIIPIIYALEKKLSLLDTLILERSLLLRVNTSILGIGSSTTERNSMVKKFLSFERFGEGKQNKIEIIPNLKGLRNIKNEVGFGVAKIEIDLLKNNLQISIPEQQFSKNYLYDKIETNEIEAIADIIANSAIESIKSFKESYNL